jgi:hypothetical protein
MHFDIPGPESLSNAEAGIKEIGAAVSIVLSGMNDLDLLAKCGPEPLFQHPEFPEKVDEFF